MGKTYAQPGYNRKTGEGYRPVGKPPTPDKEKARLNNRAPAANHTPVANSVPWGVHTRR